jgi:hypothetical protein
MEWSGVEAEAEEEGEDEGEGICHIASGRSLRCTQSIYTTLHHVPPSEDM